MSDLNRTTEPAETSPEVPKDAEIKVDDAAQLLTKLTEVVQTSVVDRLQVIFKEDSFKVCDFACEDLCSLLKQQSEEKMLEACEAYQNKRNEDSETEIILFSSFLKDGVKAKEPGNKNNLVDEEKIKALLDRTGYTISTTPGQRCYGGPPPKEVYEGEPPKPNCQVFIGKIPKNAFEDEIVPLLEQCGIIWDFRLMLEPGTGKNRGFGFCSFVTKDEAEKCVEKCDNHPIRPNKHLGVCLSQSNCRLFVGSIPKNKSRDEIFEEFKPLCDDLTDVIVYLQTEDKSKNRGFCFLEFKDHKSASTARRKLSFPKTKAFNNSISVDWADPIEEPSDAIMKKVKVLYVKNLALKVTEENIKTSFSEYGKVDRVKKIKDYAFVHFEDRDNAMKALESLNGTKFEDEAIEITLAKPIDRKKRERQMERKMMNNL